MSKAAPSNQPHSLPWSARLGYGVGDFGLNMFWQGTGFYLLFFYTDVIGLPNTVAGIVFAIGGLWDAFTDPAMGMIAERTRSRWGAYRPYLVLGSLPLAASFVLVFSVPDGLTGVPLVTWVLTALILFKTSYTIVSIPYSTLGARMTEDTDERIRIAGVRMYFGFLGGLSIIMLTNLFRSYFPDQQAFVLIAGICGLISMAIFTLCFFGTHSAARRPPNAPIAANFAEIIKTLLQNKAFLLLMGGIVLVTVATTVISSTILYVFEYGFNDAANGGTALIITAGAPLVTIPLWSAIALWLGKKNTWLMGSAIAIIGLFGLYFSASVSVWAALTAYAVISLGISSYAVLFWSMLPDTIEYGEHETRVRNESSIIGVISSGQKIALAITAYGLGASLDTIGYSAGQPQSDITIDGLILLVTMVPAGAVFLSAVFIAAYPISSALHRRFTDELHTRHGNE
jgi:GPH family glycoside/pentoside/hexuronide:cation symporter